MASITKQMYSKTEENPMFRHKNIVNFDDQIKD